MPQARSRLGGSEVDQRIVERQNSLEAAGLALPPTAAGQLVVDAPRLMAFDHDDVQATERLDAVG